MKFIQSSLSQRFSHFLNKIITIALREHKTRYAGGFLGPLWAFITPLFWIMLVVLAFRYLERPTPVYGSPELFAATGIVPFVIMRLSITSMMRSFIANRYLQYFPSVSLVDIGLATAFLEFLNAMITAVLIFFVVSLIYSSSYPSGYFNIMIGVVLALLLGLSFGSFAATLGRVNDTFARLIPLLLRPLFWVSGVFYIPIELPSPVMNLFAYNPLFHAIEIVRQGFYFGYNSPISSYGYILFCIAVLVVSTLLASFYANIQHARHGL